MILLRFLTIFICSVGVQNQLISSSLDEKCQGPGAIAFIIDGSESISDVNYEIVKNFVAENIKNFEIAYDKVQVAALSFSRNVSHRIDFNPGYTAQTIITLLSLFQRQRMSTFTHVALQEMRLMLGNTSFSSRVGVLVTDGESYDHARTVSEASIAKANGITMLGIGISVTDGSSADVELEEITGSPDNVILLNGYNQLNNITQVKAISDLLCQAVTTTTSTTTTTTTTPVPTTTTPTTTTTPPTTPIPSTAKLASTPKTEKLTNALCEGCVISDGFGYNWFAGDCRKYIVCYMRDNDSIAVEKKCGFGQFWSLKMLTCVFSADSECAFDPCAGQPDSTKIAMADNCKGYWMCIGQRSVGMCCAAGEEFQTGTGCVTDTDNSCSTQCPPQQTITSQCLFTADSDPNYFIWNVPGQSAIRQRCAPGTQFDSLSCSCSTIVVVTPATACSSPILYQGIDGNFYDEHSVIPVAVANAVLNSGTKGSMTFSGNGEIGIWRLAHYDFQNSVAIRFDITVSTFPSARTEQVLTNCFHSNGPLMPASIDIRAIRSAGGAQLVHTIITDTGTTQTLTTPVATGVPTEVIYAYDGTTFVAYSGSGTEQSAAVTGHVVNRQSSMFIGRPSATGQGVDYLVGTVSGLEFYNCIPSYVQGILTAI